MSWNISCSWVIFIYFCELSVDIFFSFFYTFIFKNSLYMRDIGLCLWCTLQIFSPSCSIVFWCCLKVYKHRLVGGLRFELVLSACSGQAGKHSFRALALTPLRHLVETNAKLLWRNSLNQATHDFLSQKHCQTWAYNSHTKHVKRQCTTGENKNSRFRQETQIMEQFHSVE